MARAIETPAGDRALCERYCENGQKAVRNVFNLEIILDKISAVYEEVLQASREKGR